MRIYEQNKRYVALLSLVLGTICLLVVSILLYNMYIGTMVADLSNSNVEQVVMHQANTFEEAFNADVNLLETTASLLTMTDYQDYIDFDSEHNEYLSKHFDYLMVIDKDGYAIGSDSTLDDLSDRRYFQLAMAGETVISKPIVSQFNNEEAIVIATPMESGSEIVGVLAGIIYLNNLGNLFEVSEQDVVANILLDSTGNIVASGVEDSGFEPMMNFYDVIKELGENDDQRIKEINDDITFGIAGSELIIYDNNAYRAIYHPVGIQDWLIMSIIPNNVVQSTTNTITILTAILSVGIVIVVGVFANLIFNSQRKNLDKIIEIAYISELTKINTAVKFKVDAPTFIKKNSGKKISLIKFDIENFKLVNETLGSDEGDRVLINMAKAMGFGVVDSRLYAHLHDDEFIIMLAHDDDYDPESWREEYVGKLYELLGEEFNYKLRIVTGYYYPAINNNFDIGAAIEKANIAHRRAKSTKALISVYDDELLASAMKTKDIENRMELALENHEFIMVLQPELNLLTGRLTAAEALVRWHGDDGPLRPDEFIPIFEQNGFITRLDFYMFEEACKYISNWSKAGRDELLISVNFSRNHLQSIGFENRLLEVCEKYKVNTRQLGIEITESSMISNEVDILDFIYRVQSKGFKVLMDDFGSGYSSLGLLKDIPVDILKLDRSFFTQSEDRSRSLAVVSSVIRLSKDLGIKTIAEGVETSDDLTNLVEMGCDIIQGYYYAKPMSQDAFIRFYESESSKLDLK